MDLIARDNKWLDKITLIELGFLRMWESRAFNSEDEAFISHSGRMIANAISDVGCRWSRLITVSVAAELFATKSGGNVTDEHPHSRQQIGEHHIRQVLKQARLSSRNELLDLLNQGQKTIKTLKTENQKLSKFQQTQDSWMDSYSTCGIDTLLLVPSTLYRWKRTLIRAHWTKLPEIQELTLAEANNVLTG